MKLGIHLSSFTPRWEDDVLPLFAVAAEIGYAAVEIPLMFPFSFDAPGAKTALVRHKLGCTCGTGMNPAEDISSLDNMVFAAGKKRLRRCIEICSELETDCLGGVLYAPWGLAVPRETFTENRKRSIEALQETAVYGARQGVTLSLEILNRYESSFVNTLEEGAQLLREIDMPNVKLHFDTFHAHVEETHMLEALWEHSSHIYHVHLCDNNRAAPGTGCIDFASVISTLRKCGYNRHLMVENFVIPNSPAGNEVCAWRKTAANPRENAEKAFAHIQYLLSGGYQT